MLVALPAREAEARVQAQAVLYARAEQIHRNERDACYQSERHQTKGEPWGEGQEEPAVVEGHAKYTDLPSER